MSGLNMIETGRHDGDLIDVVLENRNTQRDYLEQPEKYIGDLVNEPKLKSIDVAVAVLQTYVEAHSKIVVIVDADTDGYVSSSLLLQYLKESKDPSIHCEPTFILHEEKQHGLTEFMMDKIYKEKPDLVIVPDAGSNDFDQIEELYENKIAVLIIDHHDIEPQNRGSHAIILNNQISKTENGNLTGVGVVYKFCQYLDTFAKVPVLANDHLKDLVMVGQIGDSSDISNFEVRNLVNKGLINIENPLFKEMIKQDVGIRDLTPTDISFHVVPFVNAIARVGKPTEQKLFFKALNCLWDGKTYKTKKRKKNKVTGKFDTKEIEQTIYEKAYDISVTAKNRQNTIVRKLIPQIYTQIDVHEGISVVLLTKDQIKKRSLTGLLANKIVSKYQKPTLVLVDDGDVFTGSGRGYEPMMEDFKEWIQQTNLAIFAQGHPNAFGIQINKKKLPLLIELSKTLSNDAKYSVDRIYYGEANKKDAEIIVDNNFLYGGSVTTPTLGYKGVKVDKANIQMRGSVVTFFVNRLKLIMFNASPSFSKQLTEGFKPYIYMDFVGKPMIDSWGKDYCQIVLVNFAISEPVKVEKKEVDLSHIHF
jgi:single-stranded-DNA-specific exonuclease